MKTPWGNIAELDFSDHLLAEQVVSADKHQLAEGIVAECLVDQIVHALPVSANRKVFLIDVETVIVDTGRPSERWLAFVWARTKGEGLGRYLLALGQKFTTYLLDFEPDAGFTVRKLINGKSASVAAPLEDLMRSISSQYSPLQVSSEVRDPQRQKQSFWGFISNYYGRDIGAQVVLPRLLINWGIQPYFKPVWNLDRICMVDDELWLLEIKHKFPFERNYRGFPPSLHFGINSGELNVIQMLNDCGIQCLHSILVKPYWTEDVGSMYLLNDLSSRGNAAFIATHLSRPVIDKMMRGLEGKSPKKTAVGGNGELRYRSLSASEFRNLGVLSDTPELIASKMIGCTTKNLPKRVIENELRALQLMQT